MSSPNSPNGVTPLQSGWQVVCPDGLVRHYPHFNLGDAECDAEVYDERGCTDQVIDGRRVPCPGGHHVVQAIVFTPPAPTGTA